MTDEQRGEYLRMLERDRRDRIRRLSPRELEAWALVRHMTRLERFFFRLASRMRS